jgi:hypothetical protein
MWKVEYAGRVHRWLVVQNGDQLYIEPARRLQAWEFDYYLGKPDPRAPRTWQIEHFVYAGGGRVSPNAGSVAFDEDHRVLQAEWHNIRKGSATLIDIVKDTVESTDIIARGTRGSWPNL